MERQAAIAAPPTSEQARYGAAPAAGSPLRALSAFC